MSDYFESTTVQSLVFIERECRLNVCPDRDQTPVNHLLTALSLSLCLVALTLTRQNPQCHTQVT